MSTIESTALKWHIEAWLLQARISIVSSVNWAPWWQRRRVERPILARDASPAMTRLITTTGRDYSIRPMRETEYDREKSNTIPTTQLSAIISWRTYNQWRDLTPESAIPVTEGEVNRRWRVSASCIPTALATSKKPGGQQKQQRQLD